MKISVCIPSYKRPKVKTFDYISFAKVFVDEGEYDAYVKANKRHAKNIVSVPKGIQGNLCRIRNYILDTEFAAGVDCVVIIDDDMKGIYHFEAGENGGFSRHLLPENEVMPFLQKYSLMCDEFGFKMWGLNVNCDAKCYRAYTPFSTTAYLGGPFQAFLKNPLRYDERLPLKEDYDMTLQQCNKYRGVLRVNKFYYISEQATIQGGCATYRNYEKEEAQLRLLQKKWGLKIVRQDFAYGNARCTKEKVRIDFNPIIKVPIPGV